MNIKFYYIVGLLVEALRHVKKIDKLANEGKKLCLDLQFTEGFQMFELMEC